MKKLLFVGLLTAATPALACNRTSDQVARVAKAGDPKLTRIHFTKNYHKGTNPGQYNTDCIGIVTTEQIYGDKQQKIKWKATLDNGESRDDECPMVKLSTVNLRFANDVMGTGAMKKLTSNDGGIIEGEVSNTEADYNSTRYQKYQVYIGNEKAGPDPIIVVNCGSCGPE